MSCIADSDEAALTGSTGPPILPAFSPRQSDSGRGISSRRKSLITCGIAVITFETRKARRRTLLRRVSPACASPRATKRRNSSAQNAISSGLRRAALAASAWLAFIHAATRSEAHFCAIWRLAMRSRCSLWTAASSSPLSSIRSTSTARPRPSTERMATSSRPPRYFAATARTAGTMLPAQRDQAPSSTTWHSSCSSADSVPIV